MLIVLNKYLVQIWKNIEKVKSKKAVKARWEKVLVVNADSYENAMKEVIKFFEGKDASKIDGMTCRVYGDDGAQSFKVEHKPTAIPLEGSHVHNRSPKITLHGGDKIAQSIHQWVIKGDGTFEEKDPGSTAGSPSNPHILTSAVN